MPVAGDPTMLALTHNSPTPWPVVRSGALSGQDMSSNNSHRKNGCVGGSTHLAESAGVVALKGSYGSSTSVQQLFPSADDLSVRDTQVPFQFSPPTSSLSSLPPLLLIDENGSLSTIAKPPCAGRSYCKPTPACICFGIGFSPTMWNELTYTDMALMMESVSVVRFNCTKRRRLDSGSTSGNVDHEIRDTRVPFPISPPTSSLSSLPRSIVRAHGPSSSKAKRPVSAPRSRILFGSGAVVALPPPRFRFVLALASHPRCGMSSTAIHVARNSHLLWLIWRWCVKLQPDKRMAVAVHSRSSGSQPRLIKFTFSPASHEVTGDVEVQDMDRNTREFNDGQFGMTVDPVRVGGNTVSLIAHDRDTGCPRVTLRDLPPNAEYNCNGKWFVWSDEIPGMHFAVLKLENLSFSNVTRDCRCMPMDINFNKTITDQVAVPLLQFASLDTCEHTLILTVVDLEKTCATESLTLVSSVACNNLKWKGGRVRWMKKRNGEDVFFVTADPPYQEESFELFSICGLTGKATKLETIQPDTLDMSQVNESLLCVSYKRAKAYEIWDCNNTAAPLRRIDIAKGTTVWGDEGLLFLVSTRRVKVKEALAGRTVLVVNIPDYKISWLSSINGHCPEGGMCKILDRRTMLLASLNLFASHW
ncbi:hypothetical protein Pelo_11380 [Pelomyxa schiedti]|nr:hypothetical protein Pelo_11380 [Pelomyxa schiedti]